ncbi:iron-siderophore ABC transporter substrate-binding protein [Spongisporangium articulatum]|uniref:Iron-siderophore ABC transporter substrate-binding protein n=1 Tax=Spongisporangium articulatum TaxID=3362603 RepID=A0ABW8ARC4_9ACTN
MRSARLLVLSATLAAVALLSTACGSGSEGGDTGTDGASSAASFPVTIKHVYGETTIEKKPERVATVAWANHEVPLALGVVPVGMAKATWGDDDGNGVLPWVQEKLTALGARTPVLFDETDGIDFEAVADTRPDVILATYSGITQEDYDKLSKIAPTVAYPKVAWGTTYQEMIRISSQALGLQAEGDALVADLEKQVSDSFAKYPQLAGKKMAFTYIDPKKMSEIGYYTSLDTRPGFLASTGMQHAKVVADGSAGTTEFYKTISSEKADEFDDVDVFITYGDAQGNGVKAIQADPLIGKIPAVRSGAVAVFADSTPLAASANPSPLSIPWGIDDYFALIAAAADKGKA